MMPNWEIVLYRANSATYQWKQAENAEMRERQKSFIPLDKGNPIYGTEIEGGNRRQATSNCNLVTKLAANESNYLTLFRYSNFAKVVCASSNSLKIVALLASDLRSIELPYSFTQCKKP